jgi:tape measure domain-containing protein
MADLRTVLRIIAKDETKGALTKTQAELKGIGTTLGQLRNQALALAGVNFGVGGLAQLIALADGYALTTSRLKLLSGETENFAAVQKEVFEIAQSTFTTYEQTASIYGNLAASTKEVGVSSKELLVVTKALNQSYLISGSTQQEAKASTIQLVQALASGQIRGQEFNSVAEQGRRILFALKDATGLTAGALRQFANEGKLTTDFFLKAFLPQAEKINEEFDTLPLTVGRALTQLQNEFERFVGEQNKELGITRDIALAFQDLTENFESYAQSVVALGGATVAFLTGRFFAAQTASIALEYKKQVAIRQSIGLEAAAANSKVKALRVTVQATIAEEARIRALLANAVAERNASAGLNLTAQQRQVLTQNRIFLEKQLAVVVGQRSAHEALLATTTNAVAVSAGRAAIAMRLFNGTLAFFGGPIGAAVTGVLALVGAIAYIDSKTETASEAIDGFRDGVDGLNKTAESTATSLDKTTDAMTRLRFSAQFAQLAQGERALSKLRDEIESVSKGLNVTGGIAPGAGQISTVRRLEEQYGKLSEEVQAYRAELEKQIAREEELKDELTGRGPAVSGVPALLKDAIAEQKKANTEIQNIEERRRKLIDNLDKLSAELSGPKIDVEAQSDAFNIAALNTIRGQIQGDIQAGDAEKAVANLEKAKIIVEQLQKTGGASDSYLKTQLELLKDLTQDTGGIALPSPKIEPDVDALTEEAKNLQSVLNPILALFPGNFQLEINQSTAEQEALAATRRVQQILNENPVAIQWTASNPEATPAIAAQANAAGGHIRGPGSGTSDSILSWLSNGEYVMRAAVVRHYGTDFMDRLNRMVLPKFASGGAVRVPGASPPASSGAPIIFNLNGSQYEATISGGGVGDLRSALNRENMRRGTRA